MMHEESGMDFSPLFTADGKYQSWAIEKSELYQKLKPKSVKTVEFISKKGNSIYFIEAKGSFPHPNSKCSDNKQSIEANCQELYDKFHHSLDLIIAQKIRMKANSKYVEADFERVLGGKFANCKIIFLLVMGKNSENEWFEEQWCDDVMMALRKKLIPLRSIWEADVAVISHKEAQKRGIVALS